MCVDKQNNVCLRQLVTYRKIMCVTNSVRQSPDRSGPAIFEVPKSHGDILTLND